MQRRPYNASGIGEGVAQIMCAGPEPCQCLCWQYSCLPLTVRPIEAGSLGDVKHNTLGVMAEVGHNISKEVLTGPAQAARRVLAVEWSETQPS
jgi:hypothetical protein